MSADESATMRPCAMSARRDAKSELTQTHWPTTLEIVSNIEHWRATMSENFSPEFDCPFAVNSDGTVAEITSYFVPSVWSDDDNDIVIDSSDWSALSGYTGQHGYNGAVMHSSEYFGGKLYEDVMTTPGTYAIVEVRDLEDDDAPAGWCVLRRNS